MTRRAIYLDYAATSPVDPRVAAEMSRCLTADGTFANPSSAHLMGAEARRLVDRARTTIAARIGGEAEGIVFTSGATEANNLALRGVLAAAPDGARHLVTTRIEHKSVLDTAAALEAAGFDVTYVPCGADGVVSAERIAAALRPDTALVSVMHVNNETGAIQPILEIAGVCKAHGVPFHVDAAQSVGKVPLDVGRSGIGFCSLTAHKVCGPKGIGALYVRPGSSIEPLLHGGEQQGGLRPGTLPTHQIVGMAHAYALADPADEGPRLAALRDELRALLEGIEGARVNGDPARAAPHILSVAFPGVDGESLRFAIREIAVSAGSACMADSPEPSHVLKAMGLGDAAAGSSIRFSVGRFTTPEEIRTAAARVAEEATRLRRLARSAPAWCRA
ncbi:MAG TPA: cysteine desulfurase family protein [Gammaproteobacteria bacterium]